MLRNAISSICLLVATAVAFAERLGQKLWGGFKYQSSQESGMALVTLVVMCADDLCHLVFHLVANIIYIFQCFLLQ